MPPSAGSEYRRSPRVPARRSAQLEVRTTGNGLGARTDKQSFAATTHDVSREGLGLRVEAAEFPVGASLSVSLPISGRTLVLQAHVAWARPDKEGLKVGLRLHPEIADAQTRRFFETFVRESERAYVTGS